MRAMLGRLWNEELGAVVSAEIMLIATILVIGLIAGLKSVRDSIVGELGDVSTAMSRIDHSFWYGGISGENYWVPDSWYGDENAQQHDNGGGINVAAWSGGEQ